MLLSAKEEAKKITADAEAKATKTQDDARLEIREKEEKIRQTEDRLAKREDFLDKRQSDIDKEVEMIKQRVAEIKIIREKTDKLEEERKAELEKIAKLSTEEAKEQLLRVVEKQHEEDLLMRNGLIIVDNEHNEVKILVQYCEKLADIDFKTIKEYKDFVVSRLENKQDLNDFQIKHLEEESTSLERMIEVIQ
jgi:hypothetical protein